MFLEVMTIKAIKSIDTTINDQLLELYRQKPNYGDPIFHPVIKKIHEVLYRFRRVLRRGTPAMGDVFYLRFGRGAKTFFF